MIGKMLTSRYEVLDKIGEGGMALVYKGRDTLLHREVAIKVLRDQYASDEAFVERFRREAQAAASLSHPNVVNIYDVGEVDETHFIVMEYIEGENLKKIILERGPLPAGLAARIAKQICEALQHAHAHGIVHRDIKPHNILITADDRVKVTDFGIARAASSATLTQTGIVIGSVHYFSPEQARGANIGPQSDLYSVGVVLYEMLTGHVPFEGESPIAVALKQIDAVAPPVTDARPEIPTQLAAIVAKALAKDLTERYRDAEEMLSDLRRFIWLVEDRTQLYNAEEFHTQILTRSRRSRRPSPEEAKRRSTSGSRWAIFAAIVLVLAAAAFAARLFPGFFNVPDVRVPDLTGRSVEEARRILADRRLGLEIERRIYHSTVPVDNIISQDPEPAHLIKVNRTVKVTVSRGPELVVVPDLTGQDLREAGVTLSQVGLGLGQSTEEYSAEIAVGRITSQNPPPFGRLEKGLSVNVAVSKGVPPQTVVLPNFVGRAYDDVVAELQSLGFVVGRVIQEARPVEAFRPGTVLDQNPAPETPVAPGTSVDLVVSKAPLTGAGTANTGGGASVGAVASPPGQSQLSRIKRAEVAVVVPAGPPEQTVTIQVLDSRGAREVLRETHAPGDRITKVVDGVGERVRVRVFIDGVLTKDELID